MGKPWLWWVEQEVSGGTAELLCVCETRVYLHSLARYMASYMALLELTMWTGWP